MKVKTVEVLVNKTVYIAEDGEEFPTAELCRNYELQCVQEAAQEKARSLTQFTATPEIETDPDVTWRFIRVESEEDISSIVEADFDIDAVADTWWQERPQFPCWIVSACTDQGLGVLYTWDDVQDGLRSFMETVSNYIKELEGEIAE